MKKDKSINGMELNAYLDKQLTPEQASRVERALLEDPSLQEKFSELERINSLIHEKYDAVLEEDIPARLLTRTKQRSPHLAIAASVFLFISGTILGWQAQVRFGASQPVLTNLLQPATFAHSVYTADLLHPVEIKGEQQDNLNQWLSKRLKTHLSAPDLTSSGYRFIGGRLLPSTQSRMAAQYMYENQQGKRITLYVRRGEWGPPHPIKQQQYDNYTLFYWVQQDMAYALTFTEDETEQQALAQKVYQQMTQGSI